MNDQLIPEELLQRSRNILFITHLAIGDFAYLQNYFLGFSCKYPHLKVDLWIDEVRRSWRFWRWALLEKYVLYDWVGQCRCFSKIYKRTFSPPAFWASVREARKEDYPIVITLTTLRPHKYARLARIISPNGFIVGMVKRTRPWKVIKNRAFSRLDGCLNEEKTRLPPISHVTDLYAHWFQRLCALTLPAGQKPFITIPDEWTDWAREHFYRDDRRKGVPGACGRVFVNPYAKDRKRCWPLPVVHRLLSDLKQREAWHAARFIINAPPETEREATAFFRDHPIEGAEIFTAHENFFQIPAVLSFCDIVVTVETSIMHLASSVNVPTIALMRRKNPEWAPWNRTRSVIITCGARKDWIEDISAEDVAAATDAYFAQLHRPPVNISRM